MTKIMDLKKNPILIFKRILAWHFKHYILRKDSPLIATFQLTNRCNLRCRMCNIVNNPRQNTLPLRTFQRIIDDLSEMGCCYVSLSGGEPLVIEGIFSYVSYAKRTIPFVNLVTNGYFLTPDVASELQKAGLDMISISIDGFREKHDLIRGKEGSFDRAMSAISYMKRYAPQVGITVNTIISSWNLEDIFSLADLTADLGVLHKFQPILRHPSFTGQTEPYQEFDIGDIPVRRIKELVKHLLSKSNVANSRYFLSAIPGYFTSGNNGLFNEKCKLVNFFCEFRENGQMYPCLLGMSWEGGYPVEIGGVKQIFHSSRYRKDVKRLQYCKACKRNLSVCYVEPRLVFPVASYMRRIILPCHSFFKKC